METELLDFFIECAQIEQQLEMNREFLIQLPTFNPKIAYNCYQHIKEFFSNQGFDLLENEIVYLPQLSKEEFNHFILTDNYQKKNSYSETMNQQAKYALAKYFINYISLIKLLKLPKLSFQGTIEDVKEYFKIKLAFISQIELKRIFRFALNAGFTNSNIIDTNLLYKQSDVGKQISNQTLQKKQQKEKDNSNKIDYKLNNTILQQSNQVLKLIQILRKEIKLEDIRKQLVQQQDFNPFFAFKEIDKTCQVHVTQEGLNQFLGVNFQFIKIEQPFLTFGQFIHRLKLKKCIKLENIDQKNKMCENTISLFKQYLIVLFEIVPKLECNRSQFNEIDINKDRYICSNDLLNYLQNNGYKYNKKDIQLLFERNDKSSDGKLCFEQFSVLF